MNKIIFAVVCAALVLVGAGYAYTEYYAGQPERIYRVAVVSRQGVATYDEAIAGYKAKMVELGYIEGRSVIYDARYFTNAADLPEILQEVIAGQPDVINVYSTPATVAAHNQTKDLPRPIPVVFGSVGDPIAAGVVKDIQKPGTNVTGVASLATELTANRLRLLKELNPDIIRVAYPHSDRALGDAAAIKSVEIAEATAPQLGIELTLLPVKTSAENAAVAQGITAENVQGMILGGDSLIWSGIDLYIAQAIREKILFAAFDTSQVAKGALIGIGPDYKRLGEQAAVMTHKILRGAHPASMRVEVPEKLILAINLDTARAIGFTPPEDLLKRADLVIGQP